MDDTRRLTGQGSHAVSTGRPVVPVELSHRLFHMLQEAPGVLVDLARALGKSEPLVLAALERLCAQGLVTRVHDDAGSWYRTDGSLPAERRSAPIKSWRLGVERRAHV